VPLGDSRIDRIRGFVWDAAAALRATPGQARVSPTPTMNPSATEIGGRRRPIFVMFESIDTRPPGLNQSDQAGFGEESIAVDARCLVTLGALRSPLGRSIAPGRSRVSPPVASLSPKVRAILQVGERTT
jgi:hypothetical protein